MGMLWECYGNAMGMLQECLGNALGILSFIATEEYRAPHRAYRNISEVEGK